MDFLFSESKRYFLIEKNVKKYSKMDKDTFDSLQRARKVLAAVEKSVLSLSPGEMKNKLSDWVKIESEKNEAISGSLKHAFVNVLNSELSSRNLALEGVLPKVKSSFYTLEVDEEANRCSIFYGPKEEEITQLGLDPKKIADTIAMHRTKLEDAYVANTLFRQDLTLAYERALRLSKRALDRRAPVIDVLAELAFMRQGKRFRTDPITQNYSGYGRIQFSYDLYKLANGANGSSSILLHQSTRAQTRDRADYLWIPQREGVETGAIYSYIEVHG